MQKEKRTFTQNAAKLPAPASEMRILRTLIASVTLPQNKKEFPVTCEHIFNPVQHTITPYFTVEDADRLMAFLVGAFEATLVRESRYEDNSVQNARSLIGNSLIMLNESTSEYPANVSQMHIYVEDADKAYRLALQMGAGTVMQPNERPHGDRMAGIKDPCGNIWWISQRGTGRPM